MVGLLLRVRRKMGRAARLASLYETALGRVDGSRVQSGLTGEAFREAGHLYERDLDVLGAESLFGMLATTRTVVGQRALARLLLGFPPGLKPHPLAGEDVRAEARTLQSETEARTLQSETEARTLQSETEARTVSGMVRERQAAVRELAPLLELRESVALLGRTAFEQVPAESFEVWLDGPVGGFAVWMRWVMVGLTVVWVGLVVAVLAHSMDAAVLAVQGALALWLRARVLAELEAAQRLPGQTAMLSEGLRLVRGQRFESALLCGLQREVEGEEAALRELRRTLTLVEQRAKEWNYAPGLVLGVGTHAAISLSLWRARHGEAMRRWVGAWAEFEAMLALGTYAAEHPENVWPEIVDGGARFEAEGMAHPLLASAVAVRNDVRLDEEVRFLLISGSNMAGKSTLLRAMGCNVVLAVAGAPVCARGMRMSVLRVGASLALVDSLAEGKSKFLAEVERLRDVVGVAQGSEGEGGDGGCLFLIDEIFGGTNSADRKVAAEAVLRGLIAAGAIGALSTHDLALAELAEVRELRGRNVHMASPREDDPLAFDYLVKDGVSRTTNALAIVRMLGLAE
jgi:hypothetical protein